MNDRITSLQAIENRCWQELELATQQRGHAWRLATLATVDGERAAARTVVLREVRADSRELLIYTDTRSAKVTQLIANPLGTLLFWSAALSWQLRLEVTLTVADSGLDVSSRWAQIKLTHAAQDYLAALPPGTPVQDHQPERASRENFAVLTAQVTAADWLELHAEQHRRALFDASGKQWLTP